MEAQARALFRAACFPSLVVSYANPVKMSELIDLFETMLNIHVIDPVSMQGLVCKT